MITIDATNSGNDAPVINNQTFSVDENSSAGTVVGTVRATDPEGDSLILSLDDSSVFEIDQQGVVRVVDQERPEF